MSIALPAPGERRAGSAFVAAAVSGALLLLITLLAPGVTAVALLAPGALLLVCLYLALSPRLELSLAILMLYLGLLDGYLKLSTDAQVTTLARDALLYAIVLGFLMRAVVRREALVVPPLARNVLLFVVLALVQLANPANVDLSTALGGLRPQLAFVPLFALGFLVLRDVQRLRMFLVLLLVVAAANGIVGLIQFNLSAEQLASWGPGYRERVLGTGDFGGAGRTFSDAGGVSRVRPPALGSDFGFGGAVGLLALPGALALVGFARSRRLQAFALMGMAGAITGILTSQARASVVGAVAGVLAFALLSSRSRQRTAAFASLAVGLTIFYVVLTAFTGSNDSGAFDRYRTISPAQIVDTSLQSRGSSLGVVPQYIADIPLGAGLGRTGPAASVATGGTSTFNAETQFSYLIVEVGVLGMLALLALTLRLLMATIRVLSRLEDPQARAMIAGLGAPLFPIMGFWFVAPVSATVPLAPYFWLSAGGLAYWLSATEPRRAAPRAFSRPNVSISTRRPSVNRPAP